MKVGDLIKCRGDSDATYGFGIVTDETTRMVKVWWFCGAAGETDESYIDDWNWKVNLMIANTSEDSK